MRLFIAIEFIDTVKEQLRKEIELLKTNVEGGNFTSIENLHLTLVFIGETSNSKIESIKSAMLDACKEIQASTVTINGFGKFINRGEILYWRGMDCGRNITKMQDKLSNNLRNLGFNIEKREFKPHITMGRKCKMCVNLNEIDYEDMLIDNSFSVSEISLMKSERINGRMVYTKIFHCQLLEKEL